MGRAANRGARLAALLLSCLVPAGAAPPEAFVRQDKGHCIACHQVSDASAPRTRADLGPALAGERMRSLGRERLRALIEDPTRANPETVMPPFGRHRILDAAEIRQLVEYLHALP